MVQRLELGAHPNPNHGVHSSEELTEGLGSYPCKPAALQARALPSFRLFQAGGIQGMLLPTRPFPPSVGYPACLTMNLFLEMIQLSVGQEDLDSDLRK